MGREELTALRDVLDLILRLPDAMRAEIAAWLSPEAAQKPGNGLDTHPLPVFTPPRPAKAKARRAKPTPAQAAEQRLLEALAESPGLSVAALAKAVASSRSRTGERLRQLASRGLTTKNSDGHWRLTADLAGETVGPTEASLST